MRTSGNDTAIDIIDVVTNLRRTARSYFFDVLHSVLLVTWIDTLGAVATVKVNIHLKT